MVFKKYIILLSSILFTIGLSASPAFADSLSINLESPTYTTGTINAQDGWSSLGSAGMGCADYDHTVATQSSYPSFGGQSLRISDAVTSGCFGDQTFAKPLVNAVGETGATASSFSTGTLQRHFETQFDIASAVPGTQQPGMHVSVSPDRGDGSRMSYLRFEDGTTGINVFFEDVQGTANPANFVETQVATGLDRTIAHTIKLTMDMYDGSSNDVVKVYIDGILVHTGTSWENYYRYDSEAASEQSPRIIKTILWRSAGTANSSDAGKGFLFDNISLLSGPIPTPTQIFSLQDKTSHGNDLTNVGGTDTTTNLPFASSSHGITLVASEHDKLVAADSPSLSVTGPLTIETWVKFASLPSSGELMDMVSKYDNSTNSQLSYAFGLQNNGVTKQFRFRYSTDGTYQGANDVVTDWTPTIGVWYHVAVVLDTSVPSVKFYVNGTQQGSTITSNTGTSIYDSTSIFTVGATTTSGGDLFFVNGVMDDVRVWNVARTSTQLSDAKDSELTGSESGLTAYYPFESSFDIRDKTSNGNNLTNHGATEYTTDTPFAESTEAIKTNASSSQYLSAADSPSLSVSGPLTIETWVKFASLPTSGELMDFVSKFDNSTNSQLSYAFGLQNNGTTKQFRFRYSSDGSYQGANDVVTDWVPSIGVWYHVAVVLDTSVPNVKFYVNGTQQGSTITSNTGTSIYDSTSILGVGATITSGGNLFYVDGEMDDVRIWNVARTQTQINDNKSIELTGSETGLAAYYPMEVL